MNYFQCTACGSLQTEEPYWLDEAHATGLSVQDTGAAQRTLNNLAISYAVCRLFGIRNVLDFGGGDGLLCRLLRDHEINCFVSDRYATPTYAQGYVEPDFAVPDLVLAFEVFEHLARPADELEQLFRHKPGLLLASTCLYSAQNEDWWYLAKESGQHVFFYTERALGLVASQHGYTIARRGDHFLFMRKSMRAPFRAQVAGRLLGSRINPWLRTAMQVVPAGGAWSDHEARMTRTGRTGG